MSVVLSEHRGAVLTLTINRPDAHNALNAQVVTALGADLDAAVTDPAVRVVIITGSGDKAFCAGADLKELADMGADRAAEVLGSGQRAFRALETAGIPVITAVNGLALGGGFELILASTIPVLSTKAALGLPESGLGLIPGYGGTQRLPRAVGEKVAAHLMLTGTRLTADRAYDLGLTPVPPVAPGELLATANAIAETVAAQGPRAVRAILTALDATRTGALDTGLTAETGLAALAVAGDESTEGINAFLQRRPPVFADLETHP